MELAEVDQKIASCGALSLSPDRSRARTLESLCEKVEPSVTEAVKKIAIAHLEHFPETIFWDYDFLVSHLDSVDDPSALTDQIIALFKQFGQHSIIAFRYVHDFFFGFDWSKWVHKEFESRHATHPFHPDALRYLEQRGREIEALIAEDDLKYPKLPSGQPRNAYGFSRDLRQERALFEEMAKLDMIPLKMWESTPRLYPERRYLEERETLAGDLGLGRQET